MNIAFLPDLFALAILIFILALVRRRHPEARADAWLLGLFFTLVEASAHTLYATNGMPDRILHLTVLDCYLLAGLVFNWAAGDQNVPRNTRLLYLSVNGFALLLLTSIYGWNIRVPGAYIGSIGSACWLVWQFALHAAKRALCADVPGGLGGDRVPGEPW